MNNEKILNDYLNEFFKDDEVISRFKQMIKEDTTVEENSFVFEGKYKVSVKFTNGEVANIDISKIKKSPKDRAKSSFSVNKTEENEHTFENVKSSITLDSGYLEERYIDFTDGVIQQEIISQSLAGSLDRSEVNEYENGKLKCKKIAEESIGQYSDACLYYDRNGGVIFEISVNENYPNNAGDYTIAKARIINPYTGKEVRTLGKLQEICLDNPEYLKTFEEYKKKLDVLNIDIRELLKFGEVWIEFEEASNEIKLKALKGPEGTITYLYEGGKQVNVLKELSSKDNNLKDKHPEDEHLEYPIKDIVEKAVEGWELDI